MKSSADCYANRCAISVGYLPQRPNDSGNDAGGVVCAGSKTTRDTDAGRRQAVVRVPGSRSASARPIQSRWEFHRLRFRQCLIIAPRSSTCRVQLHWRLGQGADHHGRMARVAEAWDRSTAPGATSRSTISSASVRLQRLRLACRSGARLIPILATRHGRARPGSACL